ncbi:MULTISPECIES: phage minor tail protein domain-containing protein [Pantoea]|jgi:phage minor tail protein G|uniref:phage minor tail protein domain-containing protein n=1 Tax=Pantoea TaxID=53335 RepID=UPI000EA08858|nr:MULTISPECIES: phage minor tail protein G [Pantoea]MBZ6387392.1 phage minor tail protein G [Pantoea piersonii]MBZ6400703.1 phage minor tail protein G [Pantoea piersonii]MBZ6408685.1 phage minor tail protein G [Pantoea piersonii]NYB00589.1 phage minor tail protein G [Pantoea piersonii]NYB08136.1 phage minor tail protein G [Pantoea piersonii]
MFLEQTVFHYGPEQIKLSELTALQRAEFFDFVASSDAIDINSLTETASLAAMVRLNTESYAWLVSRALWNCHRETDVNDIYQEILADWPEKALCLAAEKVMVLSDLKGDEKPGEQSGPGEEDVKVKLANGS